MRVKVDIEGRNLQFTGVAIILEPSEVNLLIDELEDKVGVYLNLELNQKGTIIPTVAKLLDLLKNRERIAAERQRHYQEVMQGVLENWDGKPLTEFKL